MPSWCLIALAVAAGYGAVILVLYLVFRWLCRRAPLEKYPGQYEWLGNEREREP